MSRSPNLPSSSTEPSSHLYSKGPKSSTKTWWQLEAASSGRVSSVLCRMSSCLSPAGFILRISMMSQVTGSRVSMHISPNIQYSANKIRSHGLWWNFKGQCGISSFLPPCGTPESNSGCQACGKHAYQVILCCKEPTGGCNRRLCIRFPAA